MYKVLWSKKALSEFDDLSLEKSKHIQTKVNMYLAQSPQKLSKPLTGKYKGHYRYRWGSYRVIFEIEEKERIIKILRVGHRKNIYDKNL